MNLSAELIEKSFEELNQKYFGNQLKKPDFFKVSHSLRSAGSVQTGKNQQLTLCISDMFSFNDESFIAIMVHEMIHVLQIQTHAPGSTHGRWYKKTMCDMNRKYHLNLRLSAMDIPKSPKGIKKRKRQRASTPAAILCIDDFMSFFLRIRYRIRETMTRLLY